jgi:DNA-binding protein HU-beta
MTKDDIINKITEKTDMPKNTVSSIVETFILSVKDSMAEGNNIYIRGFGSFVNVKKARKVGRNISQNTLVIIDEHYAPKFKPAREFVTKIKNSINDTTQKQKDFEY